MDIHLCSNSNSLVTIAVINSKQQSSSIVLGADDMKTEDTKFTTFVLKDLIEGQAVLKAELHQTSTWMLFGFCTDYTKKDASCITLVRVVM